MFFSIANRATTELKGTYKKTLLAYLSIAFRKVYAIETSTAIKLYNAP